MTSAVSVRPLSAAFSEWDLFFLSQGRVFSWRENEFGGEMDRAGMVTKVG